MTEAGIAAPRTPPEVPNSQSRTVEDSQDFLAEIVGDEARAGQRLSAGPILKLTYDTAVAVAFRHCGMRPVMLCLDRIDLTRVICHMDLVRLEGRMVEMGRSSMVIEVRCFVKRPTERQFNPCHVGFVTMVAIDENGEPTRNFPPLSYDTPGGNEAKTLAAHRRAQLAERENALAWIDQETRIGLDDVMEPKSLERYEFLTPEETAVRVKGQVFSPSIFMDGRVRAGELLIWLDRLANYTARQFTRNEHTITLSINDVVFKRPLHAADRIEMVSRVTYVRTHTMEVAIDIIVHTISGEQYAQDRVEFFLLNFSPSGEKKRITTGLKLSGENQEELRRYLKARTRFTYWKAHPESYLTQSPE